MAKDEKTNVCRLLEQKKIQYSFLKTEEAEGLSGVEVARKLGENPEQAFKTLVTTGKSGEHYVFVIPVEAELSLKKAAAAVSEKSIEMLKQKDLLPLTGYIHGGCSPIGMKKYFHTVIDKAAEAFDEIYFSAGKVGMQVLVNRDDIPKMIRIEYADVIDRQGNGF